MASMPASITLAGVSKSGSPISRWITLLPWASSARALARVSKAVSVPRRAIRLASRSSVAVVTVLINLCPKFGLLVDSLFLALRSQHVRHGVRYSPGWFLEVAHLQVAQQPQGQHLPAKDDQHRGRNQQRAMCSHNTCMPDQLGKHQPERNTQPAQQRKHAHGAEQVERPIHIFQQEADRDQVKEDAEGARDA